MKHMRLVAGGPLRAHRLEGLEQERLQQLLGRDRGPASRRVDLDELDREAGNAGPPAAAHPGARRRRPGRSLSKLT